MPLNWVVMRLETLILTPLFLSACATAPPVSACFSDSADSIGWLRLAEPPPDAFQMRNAMHADRKTSADMRVSEYWFSSPDGRVMMCEARHRDGCGTSRAIFARRSSGWEMQDGTGLETVCVLGRQRNSITVGSSDHGPVVSMGQGDGR